MDATSTRKHGPTSKLLVNLAMRGQHGRACTPATLIICGPYGDPTRGGSTGYCEYYWSAQHDMTFDTWLKVAKLSKRYRRFVNYVRETLPEWKEVRRISYADDSVEAVQQDKFGRTRQVMVEAPHGDACF